MSHLNLRTRPEDEKNILFLQSVWGLDRSDITRRALAESAAIVQSEQRLTRKEILASSEFVGCIEGTTECLRSHYKQKMKKSLNRKYRRAFKE